MKRDKIFFLRMIESSLQKKRQTPNILRGAPSNDSSITHRYPEAATHSTIQIKSLAMDSQLKATAPSAI